ncbi:DNA polymerase III subunit gamma and tau, partial [Arthrobacter sp. 3Tela_A]|uniref:DNA polymerase III subunit gamma and tau n=1 Tax=Arthrobacter sp. 3Tela_A TaxID=3093743 RepID=UPI003BB80ECB
MSTALYRRYRPESFADVIGQEHVTEPLMAALSKNRVNHAYLFSGPRGCGKTTSARILARCLNCAQGPTPIPCGTCDSCVELARNGAGSLDVIEIDAASHGGVDDARDLRERATFAPVRDRYKIFIIDEAHMVTSAGFNALLKIVEEPPEHIKFIFATTEPDKVIGTIRSRTHHYPFRLVPPEPLLAYLEKLCVQEGVPVAPGVLSLVIRAGGGSVRDSLSVLDQLMAGAGESGLDYELAVNLLGYTHVALLDDVVDAFAAGDAATVFSGIDRVIQTGQDPRRFVEDLLERFRDLIVVNAMPDAAAAVLRGVPEDQINRMRTQATQFGGAELSRAADITNTALTEMTGATSPRLHLELLCARILLPAADQSERGTAARVDRIERRLSYAGDAAPAPAGLAPQRTAQVENQASAPAAAQQQVSQPAAPAAGAPAPESAPAAATTASDTASSNAAADWGGTWATPAAPATPAASGTHPADAATPSGPASVPSSPAPSRTWDDVSREAASQQSAGQGQHAQQQVPQSNQRPAQQQGPASAAPPQVQQPQVQQPQGQQGQPVNPAQAPAASGTAPAAAAAPQSAPSGQAQQGAPTGTSAAPSAAGPGQVEMIRRAWPEIMDALTSIRRATWLNVSKNASPRSFDGRVLELAFSNPGAATNFNRPDHLENLRKAIHQVLGVDCQVNAVHDSTASAGEPGPKAGSRLTPPAQTPAQSSAPAQPQGAVPAPSAPPQTEPVHGSSAAVQNRGAVPSPQAQSQQAEYRQQAQQQAAPQQPRPETGAPAAGAAAAAGPAASAPVWNIPPAAPSRPEPGPERAAPAPSRPETGPERAAPAAAVTGAATSHRGGSGAVTGAAASGSVPSRSGGSTRSSAPLPEDWPQEPSEPADVPESNAWETAAVPDDIHVSSAVSDEEWASTNWAGTTATRPGAGAGTPGRAAPAGAAPAGNAPAGTRSAGNGSTENTAPPEAPGSSAPSSA